MTIKKVSIILDKNTKEPRRMTPEAAGYDVVATSMEYLPLERCWKYGTGIKLKIPKGYYVDLRPRSSVYKVGPYILSNGCGVGDSDYLGEYFFVFKCVSDEWDCVGDPPYTIGDRIGQIILSPYADIEFDEVKKFEKKTVRGTGGFGSTNK